MKTTSPVMARIEDDMIARVDKYCSEHSTEYPNRSYFIRMAIRSYLKQMEALT